ncbi:threonine synthase [Rudanella paleaurantiibacter]|uniref:Threonine synthase n=1 Tax=Rudanella paleaurantiibacter TaxID=2614655 RepID=A0A7J5U399_9BACT|nr:threonine synthase [Rudanella paleaurantiibacter]KAB7732273.1 threonine synthase [Rudanella paleaurantiibacter]
MRFYSTNSPEKTVSIQDALFTSLPADKGLYMPDHLPDLGPAFFNQIASGTLADIGYQLSKALFGNEISDADLQELTHRAFPFETPVVPLEAEKLAVLELFHGPSLAFKDVGARYMAGLMSYFSKQRDSEVHILVATSGDTGGAVAMGFHNVPGVRVSILYPKGRVSDLQEKQLTTLGGNIQAFEVEGSFDDCQALVKQAFLDSELTDQIALSSANSINIFRLIPQGFYYVSAYGQVASHQKPVVFCTPSGNFGNLSAGVLVQKMGLPVHHFIAATNLNHVVPDYLLSGDYTPKDSVATISNAMDVGAPSNFVRLKHLYGDSFDAVTSQVSGCYFDDEQTRAGMQAIYEAYGYVSCPHTAIGIMGMQQYLALNNADVCGIALATAHPSKFKPLVEKVLSVSVDVPERLAVLASREKRSIQIRPRYLDFKEALLQTI